MSSMRFDPGAALPSIATAVMTAAVTLAPVASAAVETEICQGLPVTVHGYVGTPGDDVIAAPVQSNGYVDAGAGNDTICLVEGRLGPSRDPSFVVDAGPGDDAVTNEARSTSFPFEVVLGSGSDSYRGNDKTERVYAGAREFTDDGLVHADTETDVLMLGDGGDIVVSGTSGSAAQNDDVIATGPGRDWVSVGGTGGAVDNGTGADSLSIAGAWTGELVVDNQTRRAVAGSQDVVTWTDVNGFYASPSATSTVAFLGSDEAEELALTKTSRAIVATSTIAMGGGDDRLELFNYLPGAIDLGQGRNTLDLVGCQDAVVRLGEEAGCTTKAGLNASIPLRGVTGVDLWTTGRLRVVGTAGPDWIRATGPAVTVRGGGGDDRVVGASDSRAVLRGGPGADDLRGGRGHDLLVGGAGRDLLRGGPADDVLLGGRGRDVAVGGQGRDRCVAEVLTSCER